MSAPNVTDKSTSTEGIRTTDPQFECSNAVPTNLKRNFSLATASRSTLYLYKGRFILARADGRTRVYRRRWDRFASNRVQQVDRFGGCSVTIRVTVHHGGRTTLALITRRDPAASRHSAHELQRWNVSA